MSAQLSVSLAVQAIGICQRCRERWFDMIRSQDGVCHSCQVPGRPTADNSNPPLLYTADNQMDPGDVPNLPVLTEIEE